MSEKNIEIERKFLVKDIPFKLSSFKSCNIKQGYIFTNPVMRLRQKDESYFFTFKGIGQVKRVEFEFPLSYEQFSALWEKIDGNEIIKRRYFIPLDNNYTAELDIYEGNLLGFRNVEVEFNTEDEAMEFKPPEWFGEDISFKPEYANANISFFGLNNQK